MKEAKIVVSGRVQRVGFRYWTRNIARKLGVQGHVRNVDDGSLEILAQADEDTLHIFISTVSEGPPLAWIKDIKVEYCKVKKVFEGFEILR